jgi:hypothetical protein
MIEEVQGDVEMKGAEIHAALAELAGLRKALGRSTYAAVKSLLPFSRNDDWEVSELRQRLSRKKSGA